MHRFVILASAAAWALAVPRLAAQRPEAAGAAKALRRSSANRPRDRASEPLKGLDAYIQRGLAAWKVAGLAIAVVKGDSIVYARGFGVRDVQTRAPIDERTVFAIGSMSKFFTAVAAGMLVDSGTMSWDEPLRSHLPGFATADPYATQHLSLRDALSHRSGLDWRLDFLWYGSPFTADQVLERVRLFMPEPGFRAAYGYSNVMFAAAGAAIGNAAGTTWDAVIRDRIFSPLGMRSSVTSIKDLPASGNVATPHTNFSGEPRPVPRYDIANVRGAGAINSTAADMARWLQFVLGRGQYRGQRLIGEATLAEILSPQVVMPAPDSALRPYANFSLYGLGVELMDYKGRRVAHHAGVIDGMHSNFAVVPDMALGVVVLTNTTGPAGLPPELPEAIVYRVLDAYLGGQSPDWSAQFLAERKAILASRSEMRARRETTRIRGTQPTLPVGRYVGRYIGPVGTASVTQDGDGLTLHVGPITSRLEHWHYDTFRFRWDPIGYLDLFASFTLDANGRPAKLHLDFVGDFERAPE